jgi:DNA invertase Pin-like site-specific DNA recombinase
MITTALSLDHNIFLEDTIYMTILTRQERERLVRDLYNQGKTYREISREARISPRDIGVILKKAVEEKAQGLKNKMGLSKIANTKNNNIYL